LSAGIAAGALVFLALYFLVDWIGRRLRHQSMP